MPLSSLTCPICLAVLKPKTPVQEGSRVRCPKCKGSFVAGDEPKEEEREPEQEPMAEAADEPEEEEPAEVVAAEDEVTDSPPSQRRRRNRDGEDDDPDERPRKKKAKQRGLPTWAWFAIGGGALLLVCCGCGVPGGFFAWKMWGALAVNLDNYNKIKGNMTEAQVKSLLGGEPTESVSLFGSQSESWANGDSFITVNFHNGRAVLKSCRLPLAGGLGTTERTEPLGP